LSTELNDTFDDVIVAFIDGLVSIANE
jgi:hypothetical protein